MSMSRDVLHIRARLHTLCQGRAGHKAAKAQRRDAAGACLAEHTFTERCGHLCTCVLILAPNDLYKHRSCTSPLSFALPVFMCPVLDPVYPDHFCFPPVLTRACLKTLFISTHLPYILLPTSAYTLTILCLPFMLIPDRLLLTWLV